MNKFLFCTLPILLLLQACATNTDHAPIANSLETTDALTLKSYQEYANVYIRLADGGSYSLTVKINNQSLGGLKSESYFNVKLVPGTYTVDNAVIGWPETASSFKYKFKSNDILLIDCRMGVLSSGQLIFKDMKKLLTGPPVKDLFVSPCWYETDRATIRDKLENDSLLTASQNLFEPAGSAEFKQANQKDTIKSHQSFIDAFPETPFAKESQNRLDQLKQNKRKENWEILTRQQKCTLRNSDWLYIDESCKNQKADGNGRAVYIDTRHSFDGAIKNGQFVSGKYLLDGVMIYDGLYVNNQPNGEGFCSYEGSMEECKYYNGERVDSLYKQRIAIIEMEKRQQKELDKIKGQISKLQSNQSQTAYSGNGNVNGVGDALLDKAIDKGIEKLFESLF
jgi:hypothetical protein